MRSSMPAPGQGRKERKRGGVAAARASGTVIRHARGRCPQAQRWSTRRTAKRSPTRHTHAVSTSEAPVQLREIPTVGVLIGGQRRANTQVGGMGSARTKKSKSLKRTASAQASKRQTWGQKAAGGVWERKGVRVKSCRGKQVSKVQRWRKGHPSDRSERKQMFVVRERAQSELWYHRQLG